MKQLALLLILNSLFAVAYADNTSTTLITPATLLEQMEGPGAQERVEIEINSKLMDKANAWLNQRSDNSSEELKRNFSTLIGENSLGLKAEWKF